MTIAATHAEMARRWPAVVARAEAAIAVFAGDEKRFACSHVVDGAPAFALCSEHPVGGLRCRRCEVRHIGRHSENVETRCDECGAQSYLLHPLASLGCVADLQVRDTKGRRRRISGALIVNCLGVCPACQAQKGRP